MKIFCCISGNASIDEQITTTQGTSNDTSQRTNDFDDSDGSAWSTSDDASTNGDGDGDSITPSYSVSQTSEDPETQFGDMDSIFGDSGIRFFFLPYFSTYIIKKYLRGCCFIKLFLTFF